MAATTLESEPIDPEVVRLVDAARDGSQSAFAQLYDRYLHQVHGYVLRRVGGDRQLAEDLVGDVFLRAWRRMGSFEWQGRDLGAWLTTIARNRVNDHYKSARYRLDRTTDQVEEPAPQRGTDDPERVAVARDMARSLGRALEQLSDGHREVIELRFVHGMSVTATATALGRSTGATKALQYRALKALAEIVRDEPGLAELAAAGLSGLVALLPLAVLG